MTDPANNINISCSKSKVMQIVGTLKKDATEEPRAEVHGHHPTWPTRSTHPRAMKIRDLVIKRAEDTKTIEDLQLKLADEQTKTGDLAHSNEGRDSVRQR
ncbi:hypothetical protein CF327_g7808 [Tilletia walkeri]|nr:hypothetical protein CF327_g7808 [Tilletia walkeri]